MIWQAVSAVLFIVQGVQRGGYRDSAIKATVICKLVHLEAS